MCQGDSGTGVLGSNTEVGCNYVLNKVKLTSQKQVRVSTKIHPARANKSKMGRGKVQNPEEVKQKTKTTHKKQGEWDEGTQSKRQTGRDRGEHSDLNTQGWEG